jgi:predicted kinase
MPTMVFTMGTPGGGKTRVSTRLYPGYNRLDPDAFKPLHPDYDPKNAGLVHDWSTEMEEAAFEAALAGGKGLWVVDGTGANAEKMVRRMTEAKAAGFETVLLYVKTTLATALKRNAARERVVPEPLVREKARNIATSFTLVAPHADKVEVVEND